MMFYFFAILILSLFFYNVSYAFLPPEFFVQGLSSIWAILAGGIAVAVAPFLVFYKFIKDYFQQHKKIVIFLIIQNIVLALIIGVIFYYKFYKPLYEDSYLFPQGETTSSETINSFVSEIELDLRELNPSYMEESGYLRDKINDKDQIQDERYTITIKEIESLLKENKKPYIIDIREVEEYEVGHIENSRHLRGMDLSINNIESLFNIDDGSFDENIFILVCHDGGRGLIQATRMEKDNIKYIIGGLESLDDYSSDILKLTGPVFADQKIFSEKYQTKYQILAKDAIKILKKNKEVTLIDGRHKQFYDKKHIDGSIQLNIGRMTTKEYENSLKKILDEKNNKIIITCNRFGELFHANLLLLRLERDYGFNDNDFHIVFNQFEEFEKDPDIKITST